VKKSWRVASPPQMIGQRSHFIIDISHQRLWMEMMVYTSWEDTIFTIQIHIHLYHQLHIWEMACIIIDMITVTPQ
jgi:hypothetical protein